jgi:hypothetical protein
MKLFFLFGVIALSSYAYGQKLDCNKFKNGSFKIVDSETGTSFIKRNGERRAHSTNALYYNLRYIVMGF